MKKSLSFFSLFFFLTAHSLIADDSFRYNITKNPYRFTTYFEMQGEENYQGRVVSSSFHVRTCYDLYDEGGNYEAQAICRVLSLGVLCNWAKEIDIYDVQGNRIGFIDGKMCTSAKAKFNLYDGDYTEVARAYLDYNRNGFMIYDTSELEKPIASLKRNVVNGGEGHWDVLLYDKSTLDPRLLKIFSAFVVDYQEAF